MSGGRGAPPRRRRGRRIALRWVLPGIVLLAVAFFVRFVLPELQASWHGIVNLAEQRVIAPGSFRDEMRVLASTRRARELLDAGDPRAALEELDSVGDIGLRFSSGRLETRVRAHLALDETEAALVAYSGFGPETVPPELEGQMRPYLERHHVRERDSALRFDDVTEEVGVGFVHRQRGPERLESLHHAMGSGVAMLDLDGDGWLDLLFVGGSPDSPADRPTNALYRNRGDGSFEDVTEASGLARTGYSWGISAADLDGDGLPELYVSSYGPNHLFRNLGGMRFADVTEELGLAGDGGTSTSSAFSDYDLDGDLDLFVAQWVRFAPTTPGVLSGFVYDRIGRRSIFTPFSHQPVANQLFRNDGPAGFRDVAAELGVRDEVGRGLGVAFTDLNGDGWPDLFVANDVSPNRFYLNRGGETFVDRSSQARLLDPRAGMGVTVADLDDDSELDLLYTNFRTEYNALLINRLRDDGLFSEQTERFGLRAGTLGVTSWGVAPGDFENDGDLDLAITNGRPEPFDDDNVEPDPARCLPERQLLMERRGESFVEVTPASGDWGKIIEVGRGLVTGDLDRDGRLDLALAANNGRAYVLRNASRDPGHWLVVKPRFDAGNRLAIGARVTVEAGGRRQERVVLSGTSYMSQPPFELHFGLGSAERVDHLEVRWPDGRRTTLQDLAVDRLLEVGPPRDAEVGGSAG